MSMRLPTSAHAAAAFVLLALVPAVSTAQEPRPERSEQRGSGAPQDVRRNAGDPASQEDARFSGWLNAGAQAAVPSVRERFEFFRPVDQAERAIVEADYRSKAGLLVEGGGAVRVRGALGAGLSVSRSAGGGGAEVRGQIPHPFEFGRLREVSGRSSDLDRTELAYHVQLRYSRTLGTRVRLVVAVGPAVFSVRRHVVAEVQVDEEYPYDSAAFRGTTSRAATGTGLGYHAGADLAWLLGRHAGLGVVLRYSRGSVDLEGARTVRVDAGGVQSGVGLRLYF